MQGKHKEKRILVVDDEPGARRLLKEMLSETYTVFSAGSAVEAKELVGKDSIDLLLSDIKMPGEDGLSLLIFVKQKFNAYLKSTFNMLKLHVILNKRFGDEVSKDEI